jgi:predicted ferric reductase
LGDEEKLMIVKSLRDYLTIAILFLLLEYSVLFAIPNNHESQPINFFDLPAVSAIALLGMRPTRKEFIH